MADGSLAGETLEDLLVAKDVGHESHALVSVKAEPVGRDDAAAFLAPVLEGIEAEIGQVGRLRVVVDPENTAFFFWLVKIHNRPFERRFSLNNNSITEDAFSRTPPRF